MPTVFAIVGQHEDDPDRLLLLGDDGQHYQLRLSDGITTPVAPAEEPWRLDPAPMPVDEIIG
jgi:hypothetical protein